MLSSMKMQAIMNLLSSNEEFMWKQELQNVVEIVKQAINNKVSADGKLLKLGRPAALVTKRSKDGIRVVLLQKAYACSIISPYFSQEDGTP